MRRAPGFDLWACSPPRRPRAPGWERGKQGSTSIGCEGSGGFGELGLQSITVAFPPKKTSNELDATCEWVGDLQNSTFPKNSSKRASDAGSELASRLEVVAARFNKAALASAAAPAK
eukprot:CAMPEP_0202814920 /NCGR_PEP_ID=MMETSP1389-20130828/5929_1 /ASSEMBLY_ACC=CAM_ASM_000865 /TAXON_ID=302021 /ORGANISM="Rhodomonas sp., Strain CCMP768" /LENGTH=116 /DNA_ID=CAMNT_0049486789 /DNA_START=89 /DNA_END=439 /DNA_ORIENTATION=-